LVSGAVWEIIFKAGNRPCWLFYLVSSYRQSWFLAIHSAAQTMPSDLTTILVVKLSLPEPSVIWLLFEAAYDGLFGGSAAVYALLRAFAVDFSLPNQRSVILSSRLLW